LTIPDDILAKAAKWGLKIICNGGERKDQTKIAAWKDDQQVGRREDIESLGVELRRHKPTNRQTHIRWTEEGEIGIANG
jgi:hypothetical protein